MMSVISPIRLVELEAVIENGLKTFVDVGNALLEIRDSRLYRDSHKTFEDYCQDRWQLARRTAYQYIEAANVVENVRLGAQIPAPTNERQARPLAKLPAGKQAVVWKEAVETAPNGRVTGKHVESVVKDHIRALRTEKRRQQATPAAISPTLIAGRAENVPQIESESVDIIITSPPYNLGSSQWPMGGNGRKPREDGIGYGDNMPEGDYQDWQLSVLSEMYRIAKRGASLFYNHKPRNKNGCLIHPLEWLLNGNNPWTLRQEIIWDRGSTHNHSATLFWPEDERIYWFTRGKPTLPDDPIGMSTIWRFHGPVADTWHPAPFSEELPRRCLQAIGRPGIVVCDPFAGSCTTLRVAIELGYSAVGIDVDSGYLIQAAELNGWDYEP